MQQKGNAAVVRGILTRYEPHALWTGLTCQNSSYVFSNSLSAHKSLFGDDLHFQRIVDHCMSAAEMTRP